MNMFRSNTLLFLLLISSLLFCSCENTEKEQELTRSQRLQEVLDTYLETFNAKGVSAAVAFQNQDIWSGTSGVSFGTTAISEDMIFCIGSLTKSFMAALCLQLADEEVFCLEDSLHKWLPDYPNIDSSITIRQLLNNTSGIYNISEHPCSICRIMASVSLCL